MQVRRLLEWVMRQVATRQMSLAKARSLLAKWMQTERVEDVAAWRSDRGSLHLSASLMRACDSAAPAQRESNLPRNKHAEK